jgi:hypothetical protein
LLRSPFLKSLKLLNALPFFILSMHRDFGLTLLHCVELWCHLSLGLLYHSSWLRFYYHPTCRLNFTPNYLVFFLVDT